MTAMNNEFNYQNGVTLKEFFCHGMDEFRKETDLKFQARDKALELQADALKTRLDHLNEWRNQLNTERESFLTRSEYELKHEILVNKIDALQKFMWLAIGIFAAIDYIIQFVK